MLVYTVSFDAMSKYQLDQYTNIYGHERLWLKLWARGNCNCAILLRGAAPKQNSTIAVTEGPLVLIQRLEWRPNICFIYTIHILIVYWLVIRFLEKSRNFIVNIIMITLIAFWLMYPARSVHAKRHVYSATRVRYTQTRHHRANHLRT